VVPSALREAICFLSQGERVAGWFYRARVGSGGTQPCIVMGHGFAGVKEARLDAFADRFAAAGFACVVFDYRHLGASAGMPRQLIDFNRHRADWRAAIAYARARGDVDSARIALWGTSLGGGLALELAARRRDLRCVVLQAPLVDTFATSAGESRWHIPRIAFAASVDILAALVRRSPRMVPVVGPYGSLAFMTAPEAEPGYYAIVRNAPSWRNQATARTAAPLLWFRPARRAAEIRMPMLVVTGNRDHITPAAVTHRALRRVATATFVSYAGGHFDGYLSDGFETSVEAAIAFFRRTLGRAAERVTPAGAPAAARSTS
jgi:hypothetical protein